jgi:hypothetical protein
MAVEQFDIALSKFGVENSAVSFVPKMLGRTLVNNYRSSGMKNCNCLRLRDQRAGMRE